MDPHYFGFLCRPVHAPNPAAAITVAVVVPLIAAWSMWAVLNARAAFFHSGQALRERRLTLRYCCIALGATMEVCLVSLAIWISVGAPGNVGPCGGANRSAPAQAQQLVGVGS